MKVGSKRKEDEDAGREEEELCKNRTPSLNNRKEDGDHFSWCEMQITLFCISGKYNPFSKKSQPFI